LTISGSIVSGDFISGDLLNIFKKLYMVYYIA